jgi:hypothetical protein
MQASGTAALLLHPRCSHTLVCLQRLHLGKHPMHPVYAFAMTWAGNCLLTSAAPRLAIRRAITSDSPHPMISASSMWQFSPMRERRPMTECLMVVPPRTTQPSPRMLLVTSASSTCGHSGTPHVTPFTATAGAIVQVHDVAAEAIARARHGDAVGILLHAADAHASIGIMLMVDSCFAEKDRLRRSTLEGGRNRDMV